MISLVACISGGLIAGVNTPLLSPLVYLSKFRRDLFLLFYSLYSLALGYELERATVYDSSFAFLIFAVLLPSLLLLDAGMKGEEEASPPIVLLLLLGLLLKEVFAPAVLLAFLRHFYFDHPKRGVLVVLVGVSLLIASLVLGRSALDVPGGASAQVAFISAIAVLLLLPLWRSPGEA